MTKDQKRELKENINSVVDRFIETDSKSKSISYEVLLDRAFELFQKVEQWVEDSNFEYAAQYYNQAESLIEIIESDSCGSIGGFDIGQTEKGKSYFVNSKIKGIDSKIYSRYHWLMSKYHS